MTITEAALKLKCFKLNDVGMPVLNKKDRYYTQMQGQMQGQITECDFVLCTSKDIFIETVHFNPFFWKMLLKKLYEFYRCYIAPEIVYPTIKFRYPMLPPL